MDKSKKKSDLIAAGRKKLEKFRQMKDKGGGHGKLLDKGTTVDSENVHQDPDPGLACAVLLVSNDGRDIKFGEELSDLGPHKGSPSLECTSETIHDDKLVDKCGEVLYPVEGTSRKTASCSQDSVEDASVSVSDYCRTITDVETTDKNLQLETSALLSVEEPSQDHHQMDINQEVIQSVVEADTLIPQHVLGVEDDDTKMMYDKNCTMGNFVQAPTRDETTKLCFLMDSMEYGHDHVDEFGVSTDIPGGVCKAEGIKLQGFQCEHPKYTDSKVVPDGEELLINLAKVHMEDNLLLTDPHDPNSSADFTGKLVDMGEDETVKMFHLEEEINYSGSQDAEGLTMGDEDHSRSTSSAPCYLDDQETQVFDLGHDNSEPLNVDFYEPGFPAREDNLQSQASSSDSVDRKSNKMSKKDEFPVGKTTSVFREQGDISEVEKDESVKRLKEDTIHGTTSTTNKGAETEYPEQELFGDFGVLFPKFRDENLGPEAASQLGLTAESMHHFHEKKDDSAKCVASDSESSVKHLSYLPVHLDMMGSNLFGAEAASVSSVLMPDLEINSSKVIEELYLRSVMECVLQAQLKEESLLQFKYDEQLLDEVSKLKSLLKVAHDSSAGITQEFAHCRVDLLSMTTAKEEFETQLLLATAKIAELDNTTKELHRKLELSEKSADQELVDMYVGKEELNFHLSFTMDRLEELNHHNRQLQHKLDASDAEIGELTLDLARCTEMLVVLQTEKENLDAHLLSTRQRLDANEFELTQRRKTEEDLMNENSKIMAELHERTEQLMKAFEKCTCLEDDMRESMLYIEQLTEQNLYLSCSLDIYLTKGDAPSTLGLCKEYGSKMKLCASSDEVNLDHVRLENLADCEALFSLKEHLEDARKIIQRLDKSVQGLQSENAPRLSNKASSGVSRIIQAFESKVLIEEPLTDEVQSLQGSKSEDPSTIADKGIVVNEAQDASFAACLKLSKEESCRLIALMNQLDLDVEKVTQHFTEEKRCSASALVALRDLEAKDVARKQHKSNLESKTLVLLKSSEENMKKMLRYQSWTSDFQYRLDELFNNFCHIADSASAQIEDLHKELEEKMSVIELESNLIYAENLNALEKLRELSGSVFDISCGSNNFSIGMHLAIAVCAVSETIDDLNKKLLSTYVEGIVFRHSFQEYNAKLSLLLESNQSSSLLLSSTYFNIMKMCDVLGGLEQSAEKDVKLEELLDVLPKSCEILATQLDNIMSQQSLLHSAKVELESSLLSKVQELEDLAQNIHNVGTETRGSVMEESADARYKFLEDSNILVNRLLRSIEDEGLTAETIIETDKHPLEFVESLIYLVLGKYKETVEQLHMSRKSLLEFSSNQELLDGASMVPLHVLLREEFELKSVSLNQLQETVYQLNSSKVQMEDEVRNLNEGLAKMEAHLEKTYLELKRKDTEIQKTESLGNVLKESADAESQFLEDSNVLVNKLLKSIEGESLSAEMIIDMDKQPVDYVESLIYLILGKYKEVVEQLNLSRKCIQELSSNQELLDDTNMTPLHVLLREEFELKSLNLSQLQERVHQLNSSKLQLEDEMQNLNEGFAKIEIDLEKAYLQSKSKDSELEQSEQRLASIKEKLSIAVAKGKGLIVQRDTLKQSLAEKTNELEKCWKELQSKSASIQELESKLKVYSEAGERIEALESELSYIRNSSHTLRESFLQKDSVLQRIEEILEDFEMPNHFNFGDVTEKIEWLVRSSLGNPVSIDWDQKSSVGEAGFVASDTWKEDSHPSLNVEVEDLRSKYGELESKFYGLAEQNDMLEQSLVEKNNLVRRWEEVLSNVEMPPHLMSLEPEYKIEWLRNCLWEAQHDRDTFRHKIENLVETSGKVMLDLEASVNKTSNLENTLATVTHEKELLSRRLEEISHEHGQLLEKSVQDELEKEISCQEIVSLQKKSNEQRAIAEEYHYAMEKEIEMLKEKIHEQNIGHAEYCTLMEDEIRTLHAQNSVHAAERAAVEGEIERLKSLVNDALLSHDIKGTCSDTNHIACLGEYLKILLDNYVILSTENSILRETKRQNNSNHADRHFEQTTADATKALEKDNEVLKSELEGALSSLSLLKKDQEQILEQQKSLIAEFQALARQKTHLEEQLSQEEQKSASAREKLGVAVRKGKTLVQQRDQLRQIVEETNSEIGRLKDEIQKQTSLCGEYEKKVEHLLRYQEMFEILENENGMLRTHLQETEYNLQSKTETLNALMASLDTINNGTLEVSNMGPSKKMEWLIKFVHDLEAQQASYEEETRQTKQAAELLVSELNDVQGRFAELQEELAKKEKLMSTISMGRDAAESAKVEALLLMEQSIREDRNNQQKKLEIKYAIEQLSEACYAFSSFMVDDFNKDVEIFGNLESSLVSPSKYVGVDEVTDFPTFEVDGAVSENEPFDKDPTSSHTELSKLQFKEDNADFDTSDPFEFVSLGLRTCFERVSLLHESCRKHFSSFSLRTKRLVKMIENHETEIKSYKRTVTSLKCHISDLEKREKEKDAELSKMDKLIVLLYEACNSSILEIENCMHMTSGLALDHGMHSLSTSTVHMFNTRTTNSKSPDHAKKISLAEESVMMMADTLLSTVKASSKKWFERAEENQEEMKATMSKLRKEIQEKEVQKNKISAELVSQIKKAEATADRHLMDLRSIEARESELEGKVNELEHSKRVLLSQVNDLMAWETSSRELQKKVESLTDLLTRKDQEIEGLMQALDEEEVQMEDMVKRMVDLEKTVQQKNYAMENLETSRAKAIVKLSSTLRKFDELHHFSENLLSEIENFHVQLQGRDEEISFLRQEMTRYTNDLLTLQESNKKNSMDVREICAWLDMMASHIGFHDKDHDDMHQGIHALMESLDAHITSTFSELEDLRLAKRNKDSVLQGERSKSEELQRKVEILENSIREKDSQLQLASGTMECGQLAGASTSGALEVESVGQINKKVVTLGPIVPYARNIRKIANDHVAIDMEPGSSMPDDEDDDKGHLFKSLVTSSFVPRITRPVADRVDGIWVSSGRVLMRQPTLRLGLVIYWVAIHVLVAAAII